MKIASRPTAGTRTRTSSAASTANDGSEDVTLPNVGTTQARIKVEAVGNIFFDISNADFTITAARRTGHGQGLARTEEQR